MNESAPAGRAGLMLTVGSGRARPGGRARCRGRVAAPLRSRSAGRIRPRLAPDSYSSRGLRPEDSGRPGPIPAGGAPGRRPGSIPVGAGLPARGGDRAQERGARRGGSGSETRARRRHANDEGGAGGARGLEGTWWVSGRTTGRSGRTNSATRGDDRSQVGAIVNW